MIPPSPSRLLKPAHDEELCAERNGVERYFGRLKLSRRVATQYEETVRNYLGFVVWASTLDLLR